MSDEERKIRRWFEEGWNRRDESVFREIMAPNSVGHMAHGDVEGVEGFLEAHRAFVTAFPDFHVEIEEILTAPGRAVVRWRITGTHQGEAFELSPTGSSVDQVGTTWFHLEDGRIVEGWDTWDQGSFFGGLQATGAEAH